MERNNQTLKNIEYFIFNEKLIDLAHNGDYERLGRFKKEFSAENESAIDAAYTLLRNLIVEEYNVSPKLIESDYKELRAKIARKKKAKRRTLISVWAACACIALIIVSTLFITNRNGQHDSSYLLSILDSTNINIEQVQIVSGDNKAYVDNGTISQTQDGDVVVNSEEKLKSSDIKTEFLQLLVPNGKKTKVEFSDGTKVWVNSGSKLMYPKVFADNRREIYLDGEIYIEVAKDKSKPFIVHTKKLDVKVLGTKFNVCSYNSETDNSVILVDGRVKVLTDNNGKKELSPNQGFFYDGQTFSVKTVDTYPYICWKDGRMNLKGESLDYIFKRLSRYYNLKFNYDARKATDKFKGNLDLDAPIEDILNNLSLTVPFTYSLNNNVINITIL